MKFEIVIINAASNHDNSLYRCNLWKLNNCRLYIVTIYNTMLSCPSTSPKNVGPWREYLGGSLLTSFIKPDRRWNWEGVRKTTRWSRGIKCQGIIALSSGKRGRAILLLFIGKEDSNLKVSCVCWLIMATRLYPSFTCSEVDDWYWSPILLWMFSSKILCEFSVCYFQEWKSRRLEDS